MMPALDLCSGVCLIALEHAIAVRKRQLEALVVDAELQPMMVEDIASYQWYKVDELMTEQL